MRVRLLHFASFREAAGRDEEEREIADGTRVSELWSALGEQVALFRRFPMPPAAVTSAERVLIGS